MQPQLTIELLTYVFVERVNTKMEFQMQPQFVETDQDWTSSSSSPLRSLSVGSPESSSLFYTMPTGTSFSPTSSAPLLPHQQQTTEANYINLPIQNLNLECDNAEITKAMLAVMSSPSSAASSQKSGTFKEYTSALAPSSQMKPSSGKRNSKRSMSIMRNSHPSLRYELTDGIPHMSSSQLHHKISERRRREKLNESFQELRSLLPPDSKKDKASVLSNTLEYLSNLKIEVKELKQKNEVQEARALNVASEEAPGDSSDEKSVQIISVPSESTSEDEDIELQVTVRGNFNIIDLILDILEYLKLAHEVTLLFMDADTKLIQTKTINRISFRLKTKNSDWDQAAFQEAIIGIVTNVEE